MKIKENVLKNKSNLLNKISKNKVNILIFMVYAIVTFIVAIIFHEKWRDEAQAWLIARDLNFFDILKQMSYEGHPPLWHLILAPFAKLGFPYITESIICWIIMCITAGLILAKSPFKKGTQILILLTAPMIYLYPVIARSYCLIPLALTLIAIFYKDRKQKPIKYTLSILLLAYTHILMLGMVGILYLFFFIEEIFYTKKDKKDIKNLIICLVIAIVGLLALAFMLFGSTEKNTELRLASIATINMPKIQLLMSKIQNFIFGLISYSYGFGIFLGIMCIALIIYQAKKNSQNLVIAVISIMWQLFIYLCIYGESQQKLNTLLLIFIFIAWINNQETIEAAESKIKIEKEKSKYMESLKKAVTTGGLTLLILSTIQGITITKQDIVGKYTNAKEVAQYINQNLEENAIIISVFGPFSSAVIPYTNNIKFWNASSQEFFTYMTWNKISNEELNLSQIMENVRNNFKSGETLYLLNSNNIIEKDDEELKKLQEQNIISESLYSSTEKSEIYEEVYDLYKINL